MQFSDLFKQNYVEFSPDSAYILCAMHKRGVIQVWSLEQPDWTCKIDEGAAGLTGACWSPDSRHVLSIADFQLRVTVWSLISKNASYIQSIKFGTTKGLQFSNDGRFLAVAERRDCKDYISVFMCDNWQLVKNFKVETKDMAGLSWSPDDRT
eukprot:Colp12_sorted_trinity150504_noHs@15487